MATSYSSLNELVNSYIRAKQIVIQNGFASEIEWQESVTLESTTESDFLKEAAWVILSSGMKESIIRNKFLYISRAFYEWESAKKIALNREKCRKLALSFFNHSKKIDAIVEVSAYVFKNSFYSVRTSIQNEGPNYLMKFPYMGPVTSYHLAKNIGLLVAKPDRHLTNIANRVGYLTPQKMCEDIAKVTGEKVSVVDLVLWRYSTLNSNYLNLFTLNFPQSPIY